MKVAVAADHAGYPVKGAVILRLRERGHDVTDLGTWGSDPADYPDFAEVGARCVTDGRSERAVLLCGTGIGMSIAANKVPGIRAAAPYDEYTARVSRTHNDTNVCCFGVRTLSLDTILHLLDVWMGTSFEGGRHLRRLEKIRRLERDHPPGGVTATGS